MTCRAALNPSKRQVRQLRRDNADWPETLKKVPRSHWPRDDGRPRIAVLRSREFLVQVFEEPRGVVRLSVNRTDWDMNLRRWREDISWEDLQRLKSEAGYGCFDAVEVYPMDGDVVNEANMRHLWVLPESLHFAWRAGPRGRG